MYTHTICEVKLSNWLEESVNNFTLPYLPECKMTVI
jgi:hypothetical protein